MRSFRWFTRIVALLMTMAVPATITAQEEKVLNPEYASWAKFKPGTTVSTHDKGNYPGSGEFELWTTRKLVEVTGEKVVLEITTISQFGKTPKLGGTPKKLEIPKFQTVNGNLAKQFLSQWPAPEGHIGIGEETIKVEGGTFKCKKYESNTKSQGTNTFWVSDDVPGKRVKVLAVKDGKVVLNSEVMEISLRSDSRSER